MTPLLTHKTPEGRLEAFFLPKCDCKEFTLDCKKTCDASGVPLRGGKQESLRLSEVTEQQAKDWGFKKLVWFVTGVKYAIEQNLYRPLEPGELDNILLIHIKDEEETKKIRKSLT